MTHKNLAEIPYSQTEFDEADLKRQIADVWKAAAADDNKEKGESSSSQGGAGGSGSGNGGSSSSEWVWWNDEGIWHRQINGVDEWYAPTSDADSDWIYSKKQRKYFIKYANGAVLWQ